MLKSKLHITNRAIGLILCIFAIQNTFSGCTFSKKMQADMGFVINKECYYYTSTDSEIPNSFLYINNTTDEAQEYTWGYYSPFDDYEDIGYYFQGLNSNFAIVTHKDDSWQGLHANKLYKHFADELVYLNPESKNVELLFRSNACEIIIYGTLEYVIIYNAECNVYRYVSLEDDSIIYELESNINPYNGDYSFHIYEKRGIFEVYKYHSLIHKTPIIDSIPLSPNQYLE